MNHTLSETARPLANADRIQYRKPQYEVTSGEHDYEVRVYLPGVARDGATVTLEGEMLTIEATTTSPTQAAWQRIHEEFAPQITYRLALQLNVRVDAAGITARSEHGVLHVTLPVAEAAKPRKIAIN
jgi:HSP20 family protein